MCETGKKQPGLKNKRGYFTLNPADGEKVPCLAFAVGARATN